MNRNQLQTGETYQVKQEDPAATYTMRVTQVQPDSKTGSKIIVAVSQ